MTDKSPFAPEAFPAMPPVAGVKMASRACHVRYPDKRDVLLMTFAPGTTVAGVFTKSLCPSAPVDWCRKALKGGGGVAGAFVANSGNANAFTGQAGADTVERVVHAVADVADCRPSTIFTASTGVIGEQLPDQRITDNLAELAAALSENAWEEAAEAISTTDTYPKGATASAMIGDTPVTICGIAKGSGMIAPDMATMFGLMFTDAALPSDVLQTLLSDVANRTFNCISVDSDTSTSDTVLLFATGRCEGQPDIASAHDPALASFREALETVARDLAHQLVKDGEGASKFVTVTVMGAESDVAAKKIAFSIANSPLVKTAIAGEDANWGRVVMAIGKAGERAERDKIKIVIGGVPVAENGLAVDGFDEEPVAKHMKGREITIEADVGVGDGEATVWTCDLTHAYIDINADYRT